MPQPKSKSKSKSKAPGVGHGSGGDRHSAEQSLSVRKQLDTLETAVATGDTGTSVPLVQSLLEGGSGVARECERRLSTATPPFSELLLDLIRSLDTSIDLQVLDRIAKNRDLPDITRLGARRMAGWRTSDVSFQRMAFLDSLRDADTTLIETIGQRYPQIETVEDAVRYLLAMPAPRTRALAARMAEELLARFVLPAHILLHIDDPELQRQVMTWLFANSDEISVPALDRLARTATDPAIRELARETATALAARPMAIERRQVTTASEIFLSAVEGAGQQTMYFSRISGPQDRLVIEFVVNDTTGIIDLAGRSHTTPDYLTMVREDFALDDIPLVSISPDEARGLLDFGMSAHERSGHPLTPGYEIWEAYLHESLPPQRSEPVTMPELDDAGYAGRDDLVNESPELLEHPMFVDWSFPPLDTLGAMTLADDPTGEGIGNAQYEPVIEALVHPQRRQQLRSRLRRQAWVLDRAGDERERDLALAVSASLRSIGLIDLVSHPFLRALADKSVAGALGQADPDAFDPAAGLPSLFDGFDDEEWDDEDWDEELAESLGLEKPDKPMDG